MIFQLQQQQQRQQQRQNQQHNDIPNDVVNLDLFAFILRFEKQKQQRKDTNIQVDFHKVSWTNNIKESRTMKWHILTTLI